MIELESFIDLHTHTRYPDNNNFPYKDIELAAKNGGYSDILAMPNSEIVIDTIEHLNTARKIDNALKINIDRMVILATYIWSWLDVPPLSSSGHFM